MGDGAHFRKFYIAKNCQIFMAETVNMEKMYRELLALRNEVQFIKTHMFDPDTIMTTEEEERYERAMQELQEGKTTSLEDLEKELGM